MKQHVGGLSDSLVEDPDVAAMRAALQAKKASIKPRARGFSGTSQQGDGDMCPVPGHGRMYVMAAGREWCPHQEHDNELLRGMKNVTPDLTPGDTVVTSKRRQSAKGRLNPKLGARTPAAASSTTSSPRGRLSPVEQRSVGTPGTATPSDMLIDLSAMLEDLE